MANKPKLVAADVPQEFLDLLNSVDFNKTNSLVQMMMLAKLKTALNEESAIIKK